MAEDRREWSVMALLSSQGDHLSRCKWGDNFSQVLTKLTWAYSWARFSGVAKLGLEVGYVFLLRKARSNSQATRLLKVELWCCRFPWGDLAQKPKAKLHGDTYPYHIHPPRAAKARSLHVMVLAATLPNKPQGVSLCWHLPHVSWGWKGTWFTLSFRLSTLTSKQRKSGPSKWFINAA